MAFPFHNVVFKLYICAFLGEAAESLAAPEGARPCLCDPWFLKKGIMSKILNLIQLMADNASRWVVDKIGQRYFVILLSLVVGVVSGLAAVTLKHTIAFVKTFVDGFSGLNFNWLLLVSPAVGILISWLLVRYVIRGNLGHGITQILYAISQTGSSLPPHHIYSSIVTSSFTIGFGGSVGAEAPIALTGAGIGSNIAKFFKLDYKTVTLLMACGAAGGIAGVFKAPIAGVVFTLEILMLNLTMASMVPLMISAVVATSVTYWFMGSDVEFSMSRISDFILGNVPFYCLLGVFAGFVSLLFARTMWFTEGRMGRISNPWVKWVVGSSILGVLIFLLPPLYGEGYTTISQLLQGNASNAMDESPLESLFGRSNGAVLLYAGLILLLKAVATASTTGAGGVGGTFAPSLFMGAVTGFFFSQGLNTLFGCDLPTTNFTLVGMAGVMAGVMHAPMTAIFLIAEITNGYSLLLPLMITSTLSHVTMACFEPQSIYTKPLADKGELLTHKKDKTVLTLMHLDKVIETDFTPVKGDATLGDLIRLIAQSSRNIFPVVNGREELIGVVLLNDIRPIMFDREKYEVTKVRELMIIPPAFISTDENMESVMDKFESTGAWNLPVVDHRKYVGFVSKSKILTVYRRVLTHISYE